MPIAIMERYIGNAFVVADEGTYITVTDNCGMVAGHSGDHKAFVKIDKATLGTDVEGKNSLYRLVWAAYFVMTLVDGTR